jgi:hypothetical protein
MKTASAIDDTRLALSAALQAPATGAGQSHRRAPSHDEVERRFGEVDTRGAWYLDVQSRCSEMLAIAGTGILLYSASLFLHPTREVCFPTTDTLPGLTTSAPSPAKSASLQ